MTVFEWKGLVRVSIGEVTRGQQLSLWRDSQSDDVTAMDGMSQNEHLAALLAVYATRRVEVCIDGKWQLSDGLLDIEGELIPIAKPELPSDFDGMPRSLANGWIETALATNGGLMGILSFPSASLVNSGAGSEPKPAND